MILIIGFTILGLFGFIFVCAVCILAYLHTETDQENCQVKKYKISNICVNRKDTIRNLTVTAYGCLIIMLFGVIYMFVTVPEADINEFEMSTQVTVTETPTEETIVIIPTVEETIPDKTPASTKPSTTPSEVPSTTEPVGTTPDVDPDEREMLACVIYQEAGGNGSCDDCRRYVGDIVLNRVADPRFPNTMYEVLTAKSQYGTLHWTGIKWPDRAKNSGEKEAVARAYRIAEELLSGNHSELYGNGYIWQAGFKQGTDGFWCCGHFYGR